MENNKKSIGLICIYPPPFGGVSVHCKRLFNFLNDQEHWKVKFYCGNCNYKISYPNIIPSRFRYFIWETWFFQNVLNCNEDIIHCHFGYPWATGMLLLALLGKKIVITFHDQMFLENIKKPRTIYLRFSFHNRFSLKLLSKMSKVIFIAVNEKIKLDLKTLGIIQSKIMVLPAFIPPSVGELRLEDVLPDKVIRFRSQRNPLLVIYGVHIWFDEHGVDLYGFDMSIELISYLKSFFPRVGLIVFIPNSENNTEYIDLLRNKIAQLNLRENVSFLFESIENAAFIWKIADVYIRPTITDGDSLAIRESLSWGTPVLASDAVSRPEGTVLFKSRDQNDLNNKCFELLSNIDEEKKKITNVGDFNSAQSILQVYENLISN